MKSVRATGKPAPVHEVQQLFTDAPGTSWRIPGRNLLAGALEFESGVIGSILFDGNTTNSSRHGFTIYGTKGILLVGDPNEFGGECRLILPGSPETVIPFTHGYDGKITLGSPRWFDGYGHRGIGAAEMAWALRRGRRNNRCSKEYGLHCMEVLIGMDESAGTGLTYEPQSRFTMDPLTSGYYSSVDGTRLDAERSLMD